MKCNCGSELEGYGSSLACSNCGHREELNISIDESKKMIDKGAQIVDVRDPEEWDIVHLENAKLIPIAHLVERLGELDKSRKSVTYCHHGIRGLAAAKILREHGFDVKNMQGGIEEWALKIDKKIKRY